MLAGMHMCLKWFEYLGIKSRRFQIEVPKYQTKASSIIDSFWTAINKHWSVEHILVAFDNKYQEKI